MKNKLNWKPAAVGLHWFAENEFSISTRVTYENGQHMLKYSRSGYVLNYGGEEIGIYKTLKAAQRAAEAL